MRLRGCPAPPRGGALRSLTGHDGWRAEFLGTAHRVGFRVGLRGLCSWSVANRWVGQRQASAGGSTTSTLLSQAGEGGRRGRWWMQQRNETASRSRGPWGIRLNFSRRSLADWVGGRIQTRQASTNGLHSLARMIIFTAGICHLVYLSRESDESLRPRGRAELAKGESASESTVVARLRPLDERRRRADDDPRRSWCWSVCGAYSKSGGWCAGTAANWWCMGSAAK